jgi:hypothetical protein
MTTKINRFLALIPVVAFAAACSGVAPTGSSQITSNDSYDAASAQAATMTSRAPDSCKDISGVSVKVVHHTMSNHVYVAATYLHLGPVIGSCTLSPAWTASRRGLTVDPTNSFRAYIARRTDIRTTVTATAPNGRSGKVTF